MTQHQADLSGSSAPSKAGHWIENTLVMPKGDWQPILDPARGVEIGEVALADQEIIDTAVTSATRAAQEWAEVALPRRVQILQRFRRLVEDHIEDLAALITEQNGKTLDDARGELARGLDSIDDACSAAAQMKGDVTAQTGPSIDTYAVIHPVGVCLGITPFNFPAMIPLGMMSVAIVAGNAFILKPSEQDPGPGLLLAELFAKAGLPSGVLSVVNGGRGTTEALIDHPDIGAVSMVGSTPVAKAIYARAAASGKRAQTFGGAKNHMVVMPDANLNAAADALSSAAFGSAGQRCMAITTLVAVGPIADALVAQVAERARAVKVAPGTQNGAEMGPLINATSLKRVLNLVRGAREAGASLVVDRSEEPIAGCADGFFVGPTVIDHVSPDMAIYQEEVFGPVLVVLRVDTLDEAIDLINRNKYGNGAALFTRDGNAARRFQRHVTAGQIGINVSVPVPVASFAFAGWKASSFGDTGLNNGGWRFFTRPKHITTRWGEPILGIDMGFRPN